MKRRTFLKWMTTPLVSLPVISLFGGTRKSWAQDFIDNEARSLRIWSYYVPLLSYSGIIEAGDSTLDRKVIFEEVIKKTDRISGKETDGTKNTASFEIADLESAEYYIRVKFWHDDSGTGTSSSHSLFLFKRYLEDLQAGKKVFVATGMYQGHFHVVMIQPPTEL